MSLWISIKKTFSVALQLAAIPTLKKSLLKRFLAKTCQQCKTVDNITFELETCYVLFYVIFSKTFDFDDAKKKCPELVDIKQIQRFIRGTA